MYLFIIYLYLICDICLLPRYRDKETGFPHYTVELSDMYQIFIRYVWEVN